MTFIQCGHDCAETSKAGSSCTRAPSGNAPAAELLPSVWVAGHAIMPLRVSGVVIVKAWAITSAENSSGRGIPPKAAKPEATALLQCCPSAHKAPQPVASVTYRELADQESPLAL